VQIKELSILEEINIRQFYL